MIICTYLLTVLVGVGAIDVQGLEHRVGETLLSQVLLHNNMTSRGLALITLHVLGLNAVRLVSTSRGNKHIVVHLALEVINQGLAGVQVLAIVVVHNLIQTE